MAKVLVTEHESGARKELDTETGGLSGIAIPSPVVNDVIERLWPKDSRGRWQELGGTMFVLYRVGTRLYFRAGNSVVELGPKVTLELVPRGKENEVVATRDGVTLLRARYPSQDYRRVDSFIDPWETDDDLDLVLFATQIAADPGRRQRMFATEEEIRDGEITPDDVTRAVRAAVTARFPRTRAIAIFRELARWWWKWQPLEMDGWGPHCTLCSQSPISKMIVGVKLEPLTFTMEAREEKADLGFCEWCVTAACRFLATEPAARLRADAALADMVRALRDRGELRDEEIAARLASMCAAVPPDPVIPAGTACSICESTGRDLVAGTGDARVCAGCVRAMRAEWLRSREDWNLRASGASADSRWEAGGYILVLHGAYRLHIPLSPHPDLPVVISPGELDRWDTPYDDVPLDGPQRALVESQIRSIVRKQFQREVEFRD